MPIPSQKELRIKVYRKIYESNFVQYIHLVASVLIIIMAIFLIFWSTQNVPISIDIIKQNDNYQSNSQQDDHTDNADNATIDPMTNANNLSDQASFPTLTDDRSEIDRISILDDRH